MTDWIGEVFTSDRGWGLLEDVVDIGDRMAGTAGERRAAGRLRDALAALGCDVREETFDVQRWSRGESVLATPDGSEDCVALPRSPAGECRGRLVDLGDGMPDDDEDRDLDGAVAMASSATPDHVDRFVHRREKYHRAARAGAEAFVFRNHIDGCLAPTGSVGSQDAPVGPIPAVGVSKEVGLRLARRYAGPSDDGTITVGVDCATESATSRNVATGIGPSTDERVLVTCHVDAHDVGEGAVDNAAGMAAVVEIAGALTARRTELDRRIEVVGFGSEEVGLIGSEHDARTRDLDDVVAVINVDGIARDRTLAVYTHRFPALDELFQDAASSLGHPIETIPRTEPHSDHWPYVRRGTPGCHAKSATGRRDRGWGHTRADTVDKLERRTIREQAILLTEAVVRAGRQAFRPSPVTEEAIERALEQDGHHTGLRSSGDGS